MRSGSGPADFWRHSTSTDQEVQTGNKISAALMTFPVSVADPVDRLQRIQEIVKSHRQDKAANFFSGVTLFLVYLPERADRAAGGRAEAHSRRFHDVPAA